MPASRVIFVFCLRRDSQNGGAPVFRTVERFLFAFSHDYCEKIKIANQELAKFRSSDEYDPEEIDDNKEHMSQYNG